MMSSDTMLSAEYGSMAPVSSSAPDTTSSTLLASTYAMCSTVYATIPQNTMFHTLSSKQMRSAINVQTNMNMNMTDAHAALNATIGMANATAMSDETLSVRRKAKRGRRANLYTKSASLTISSAMNTSLYQNSAE